MIFFLISIFRRISSIKVFSLEPKVSLDSGVLIVSGICFHFLIDLLFFKVLLMLILNLKQCSSFLCVFILFPNPEIFNEFV